ncbi:MAG: glycoside hydrolase family 2, partial [Gammaproteobacteria bacterium]|nr:glycoside hydrolase family 2 [Gammaproteobacteria bacterium]
DCNGVTVEVLLARPTRDPELAVELVVRQASAVVSSTLARPDRRVLIAIADPEVWTPSSPSLYDLDVRLLRVNSPLPTDTANLVREVPLRGDIEAARYANVTASGRPLDEVRCYFGLRHIELGAHPDSGHPTLLLNGTPEFQLGTLDQGWWPDGLHTPPSDAAMIHEIEFLKAAGFNTIRKHIKVEPARYYYHCDRLGLLVWQDMPSGFLPAQFVAPNDQNEGLRRSSSTADYEHELQQMIRGLRCHPCIVVWVLHNEGWGQFDTHRLSELIKLLDPTRVVDAVSGWLDLGAGDLIDRHDYEPTPAPPAPDGRRALVIGEYGGIGWPIDGHLWDPEMRNWGYQTFHHAAAFEQAYTQTTAAIIDMYRNHNLCAAIYTQTTDVEGEVNGLLSYDRKVEKLPREWFAGVHAPLR